MNKVIIDVIATKTNRAFFSILACTPKRLIVMLFQYHSHAMLPLKQTRKIIPRMWCHWQLRVFVTLAVVSKYTKERDAIVLLCVTIITCDWWHPSTYWSSDWKLDSWWRRWRLESCVTSLLRCQPRRSAVSCQRMLLRCWCACAFSLHINRSYVERRDHSVLMRFRLQFFSVPTRKQLDSYTAEEEHGLCANTWRLGTLGMPEQFYSGRSEARQSEWRILSVLLREQHACAYRDVHAACLRKLPQPWEVGGGWKHTSTSLHHRLALPYRVRDLCVSNARWTTANVLGARNQRHCQLAWPTPATGKGTPASDSHCVSMQEEKERNVRVQTNWWQH